MHESWPLKLLPTSQQTLYWTQTTPREKNNSAFVQTQIHNFKCNCSILQICILFVAAVIIIFFYFDFATFIAPEESITFIFPRWKKGLSGFSAWDWDLTASIFLSALKTFRFRLGLCESSSFPSVLLFVWVATWWLLYQEQCLGWCALRQARTTPEPASPWKVRDMTTCVWCLNLCCDKSAPVCQLVAR